MNNLAEYLAGTNPNDITSLLELTDAVTIPAVNVYTDTVNGVGQKFYNVEVE
ncbi:MAG: hypothetical protein WCS01_02640 [bacterium]